MKQDDNDKQFNEIMQIFNSISKAQQFLNFALFSSKILKEIVQKQQIVIKIKTVQQSSEFIEFILNQIRKTLKNSQSFQSYLQQKQELFDLPYQRQKMKTLINSINQQKLQIAQFLSNNQKQNHLSQNLLSFINNCKSYVEFMFANWIKFKKLFIKTKLVAFQYNPQDKKYKKYNKYNKHHKEYTNSIQIHNKIFQNNQINYSELNNQDEINNYLQLSKQGTQYWEIQKKLQLERQKTPIDNLSNFQISQGSNTVIYNNSIVQTFGQCDISEINIINQQQQQKKKQNSESQFDKSFIRKNNLNLIIDKSIVDEKENLIQPYNKVQKQILTIQMQQKQVNEQLFVKTEEEDSHQNFDQSNQSKMPKFGNKSSNLVNSILVQQTIQNQTLKFFNSQQVQLKSLIQLLNSRQIRIFDYFDLDEKKQFFMAICDGIEWKGTTNRNRNKAVFAILMRKKLLSTFLHQLKTVITNAEHTLLPRLFLLCLYKKQKLSKYEQVGNRIQLKIQQLKRDKNKKQLDKIIQENQDNFCFDESFSKEDNFSIFKLSVYYLFNQVSPTQLRNSLEEIFKLKNSQSDLSNVKDQKKDHKLNQNNQQGQKDSVKKEQKKLISQVSQNQAQYNKQKILFNLNQIPFYGNFFKMQNNYIMFNASNLKSLTFNISIEQFIKLDYPQIQNLQGIGFPKNKLQNQQVNMICKRWPKLKTLYIWDCQISNIQGLGVQNLKQLKYFSISNNSLSKNSVQYLLKNNIKWQNLIELRITFIDGSQSWDLLIQDIYAIFPKIKQLYIRGIVNVNQKTIQKLLNLRLTGLYVYLRIEKQYLDVLKLVNQRTLDFDNGKDFVQVLRIQKQLITNKYQRIIEQLTNKLAQALKQIQALTQKLALTQKQKLN